ncbi:putative AIM2 family protein [Lachnellula arida]|uniref:Putative AIM2 family protein n=1 Tax=Lachnellula arida TaxID=1316785 RepID=A0A8T9AY64_9HELO|nr:putative AIM2 family protein [Lachnellula arida]
MAQHVHSAACCSIPPIVSKGYKAKGEYKTIGGLNNYVTGPTATKALLYISDIFGYFEQSLQGADILATSDKDNTYQVFMPDLFDGKPADISWYPPNTPEKGQKLGNFFKENAPDFAASRIRALITTYNESNPNIKIWGVVGFCWGGKIVSLTSGKGTPFKAAVEVHPAMVDPADAEGITIPLALLASKDEPAGDVKAFEARLKVEKHVETFGDQIHGFMAARSDLANERVKAEYERGYKTVLEFFAKHL